MITRRIMLSTMFSEMAGPVDFNNQLRFRAIEIGRVFADGVLPPKFHLAALSITQQFPQLPLARVGSLAQKSGTFNWIHALHEQPLTPGPSPPSTGRGEPGKISTLKSSLAS